ncbi:MAG: type II toxin-antitoxin system RelE/ParE family toxin [Candidatus Cloacimonetes bacterium]|nr:type II toxin-antitoxin system RelE/ParE family toxin [Candidatus Cloacimonadota bacterium]
MIASNLFLKFKKKSSKKLQLEIDKQVKNICNNPEIGELKKGDLKNIRVYKFTFGKQLILLSYEIKNEILFLYSVGSHENFYKKLKQYLR